MFAVVIPTLQRSQVLDALLGTCSDHPAVAEIVVINNAGTKLGRHWPKTTVLQQRENIFVNPSWNLGAASTTAPWLAILNDDILFRPEVLTYAARWMENRRIGIIGVHLSDFSATSFRPRIHPEYHRRYAWGTAMFMNRTRYVPVPASLSIFYGDDWLFNHQKQRNFSLRGAPIMGDMSASSADGAFSAIYEDDRAAWQQLAESPYAYRFRREERAFRALVAVRDRCRSLFRSGDQA